MSQLASQLRKLQLRPVGGASDKAGTGGTSSGASFLFSKADAKSYSREQILELATDGLRTLLQMDNRLHAFLPVLFHQDSARRERALLTTPENKILQQDLESFLTFLSPHLFMTAAHQVLEYLIRVYEVHVYNATALIRAFLPYHDHNIFSRMLLLVDLRDTGFDFLATNQERGAPLPREELLMACVHSRRVLQQVCYSMILPLRLGVYHGAANALFAAVACRLATPLAANSALHGGQASPPESIWRQLLPILLECFTTAAPGMETVHASGARDETDPTAEVKPSATAALISGRGHRRTGDTVPPYSREAVCTALLVVAAWSAESQFNVAMLLTILKPLLAFTAEQAQYAALHRATEENTEGDEPPVPTTFIMPLESWLCFLDVLCSTQSVIRTEPHAFVSAFGMLQQLPWKAFAMAHPKLSQMELEAPAQQGTGGDRRKKPWGPTPLAALLSTLVHFSLERLRVSRHIASLSAEVRQFLLTAVTHLPLPNTLVQEVFQTVMLAEFRMLQQQQHGEDQEGVEAARKFFSQVYQAVERRYQQVFDATLSNALRVGANHKRQDASDAELSAAATSVLSRHLNGTRYEMVTVQDSAETVQLPLFACLLHPSAEVRVLGSTTLRTKLSLEQLTTATTGGGGGSSLLELAAHVLAYESNATVALELLRAVAAPLEALVRYLHVLQEEKSTGKRKSEKGSSAFAAVAELRRSCSGTYASGAVKTLLEACQSVALCHASLSTDDDVRSAEVRQLYWTGIIQPLLKVNEEQKAAAAPSPKTVDLSATLLYSTAVLYETMSTAAQGGKGSKRCLAIYTDVLRGSSSSAASVSALLQHRGFLEAVKPAAASRLPELLRISHRLLRREQQQAHLDGKTAPRRAYAEAVYTECAVATTSCLFAGLTTQDSPEALRAAADLLAFLLGSRLARQVLLTCTNSTADAARQRLLSALQLDDAEVAEPQDPKALQEGYLLALQQLERDALRLAQEQQGQRHATGRGAQTSILVAGYRPENALTGRLATAVGAAIRLALSAGYTSSSAPHPDALHLTVLLLPLLGSPLPLLTAAPTALPYSYLRLAQSGRTAGLQSLEHALGVRFYDNVHAAVFGEEERVTSGKKAAKAEDSSPSSSSCCWGAVGLVLLLPLSAPEAVRHKHVELVQDAVLRAVAPGGKTDRCAAVQVLQQALQAAPSLCSVTSLSAVVEGLAKAASRLVLPASASKLLGHCLVAEWQPPSAERLRGSEEEEAAAEKEGESRAVAKSSASHAAAVFLLPRGYASDVIQFFFPLAAAGKVKSNGSQLPLDLLFHSVEALLQAHGTQDREANPLAAPHGGAGTSQRRTTKASHAQQEVPAEVADYIESICARSTMKTKGAEKADEYALKLVLQLLETPFLRVTASSSAASPRARSLYRYALDMLAVALQEGESLVRQDCDGVRQRSGGSGPTIFRAGKATKKAAKKSGAEDSTGASPPLTEAEVRRIAAAVRPRLFSALLRMGTGATDLSRLCVQTIGGFNRLFLPLLAYLKGEADGEGIETVLDRTGALEVLVEQLELLMPVEHEKDEATESALPTLDWSPPSACVVLAPLTFQHCEDVLMVCDRILQLPKTRSLLVNEEQGPNEDKAASQTGSTMRLMALRLLSTITLIAPTVVTLKPVDSDDDIEEEAGSTSRPATTSLYSFIQNTLLERFPLRVFLPLLAPSRAADDGTQKPEPEHTSALVSADPLDQRHAPLLFSLYTRPVLSFLERVIHISLHCTATLREDAATHDGDIQLRASLLKEGLEVMAALLLPNSEEEGKTEPVDSTFELTPGRVALISALLKALSPLLAQPTQPQGSSARRQSRVSAVGDTGDGASFSLHIPIVALLIRLEPAAYTQTLGFKSSVDVCREILTSFDVTTQMRCLSQLMALVCDPAKVLAREEAREREEAHDDMKANTRNGGMAKLFRRLVKPNQILNRQELLLQVINTMVKSDAFLAPFIQLQYEHQKHKEAAGDDEGNTMPEVDEKAAACTALLTSTLSLFSHYSDLNQSTPGSEDPEDEGLGEEKSYVMLLELLAGNTLACVLAGINEPTFVQCLETLLGDQRLTVQLKGLEVLLDRLHHALPTMVEDGISGKEHDEELEQYRKNLRDPKVKLSLMDLVRVRARPLTTKRSFLLQDHLAAMVEQRMKELLPNQNKASAAEDAEAATEQLEQQRFQSLVLAVACMEELVRIVGSGGSLQAEKTLLNVHRSKSVTETTLVKMFGNKKRVTSIHNFLHSACTTWIPQVQAQIKREHSRAAASHSASHLESQLHRKEGLLSIMTGLLTLLGTSAQVLGAGFMLVHCQEVLHALLSAAVFQVTHPGAVRGGATVEGEEGEAYGSLLRYATLTAVLRCFPSCWHMSQPYLAPLLLTATHLINVEDSRTQPLCEEVLAVLEAVMEPQVLLRAAAESVWGWTPGMEEPAMVSTRSKTATGGAALRVRTHSHDMPLFYGCVNRLLERLKKEELAHLRYLCEGTRPGDSFWLASMDMLAQAPVLPPSDITSSVITAFRTFFIKFKAKHCNVFLTNMAIWAFGEAMEQQPDAAATSAAARKKRFRGEGGSVAEEDVEEDERSQTGTRQPPLTRSALQRWTLYYTLYGTLLKDMGSIMDFSFGVVVPYVIQHLHRFNGDGVVTMIEESLSSSKGKKDENTAEREEAHGDSGFERQHKSLSSRVALFLEEVLDVFRQICVACTPGPDYDYAVPPDVYVAHTEVFNSLMPALVRQLSNQEGLGDALHSFQHRAEHAVIPALRAFFTAVGSSSNMRSNQLQSKTQAEVLRLLRHPHAVVRRTALKALDGLYADGGEELAARLMAEMLPAVVELTEDRDALVVHEATQLCDHLSAVTGQDVLHAMSA
eukprot:gene3931-2799_t